MPPKEKKAKKAKEPPPSFYSAIAGYKYFSLKKQLYSRLDFFFINADLNLFKNRAEQQRAKRDQ